MSVSKKYRQRSVAWTALERVARRLWLARLGRTWMTATFWFGGVCFPMLLIRRLGGLGADWFLIELLAGVPLIAALFAFLVVRKSTILAAARKVDASCGANDLFLTLVQLETTAGEYQPAISQQADLRSASVVPSAVVPWHWQRPVAALSGSLGVLIAASLFLPQFDLFGNGGSVTAAVAARQDLLESRRETTSRLAELSARRESAMFTEEVDQSLEKLAAELRQLTAERFASGLKVLDVRQREIEARWREARSQDEVSRVLEQAQATQLLGEFDQRSRQWIAELAKGQMSSVDEVFRSLDSDLEKLDSISDGAERGQLEKEIRQAMAELQRFAGNQLQSQPIEAAMKRAMSQLDSSRLDSGLQKESTQASQESLELAQAELHEVANAAAQLASLEQALNVIQSAKQLAQQNTSQSSEGVGKSKAAIHEFVEQYADLKGDAGNRPSEDGLRPDVDPSPSAESQGGQAGQHVADSAGRSEPDSPGTGGRSNLEGEVNASEGSSAQHGAGRSTARESQVAETGFRDSREAAVLDAARRLMTMRRQGLADAGKNSQEYREQVRSLQKRVRTAIEVEEIPPGYVSGIRDYFDSLDERAVEEQVAPGDGTTSVAPVPASDSSEAADDVP
ncbi:MAG: hypothetical protein O2945_11990 [Planctomycetota bacterium]|nr:hypothetical protein [Planctomycetota bacterium]